MSSHICKTCRWAVWQKTKTGRNRLNVSGRCCAPPTSLPPQPRVEKAFDPHRYAIWINDPDHCEIWGEKVEPNCNPYAELGDSITDNPTEEEEAHPDFPKLESS